MVRTSMKKKKKGSEEKMRNWSESSTDVLSVIARRLTVGTDRLRFSEVCRNWSSVAKSEINYLPCNPPWLMVVEKPRTSLRLFFSACGTQRFELDLPEIQQVCVGSNGRWLVMVDSDDSSDFYLLNPVSLAKFYLPNVCSYYNDGEYSETNGMFLTEFEADKVVLSFINSDSDFVAMVIFRDDITDASTLAYTRKGANSWQALVSPPCSFDDILIFNGELYALDNRGILFKCLIGCYPHTLVQVSDKLAEIYCEDTKCEFRYRYLVQINGSMILQVLQHTEWIDAGTNKMPEFRVFMFDQIAGRWVETYHLGEYSLVLSESPVAISSSSSNNIKPNCIYFSAFWNERVAPSGFQNIGVLIMNAFTPRRFLKYRHPLFFKMLLERRRNDTQLADHHIAEQIIFTSGALPKVSSAYYI